MSDPMKTAQAKAKAAKASATAVDETATPTFGVITFDGVDYPIVRKPNTLLISELARTGSGDPDAMGVFAEFFEAVLGGGYYRFKKAMFKSDAEEDAMQSLLQSVLEQTLGRPTE